MADAGGPARRTEPGDRSQVAERAAAANARLLAVYGPPPPRQPQDPLSELVATILSQHTSDLNTERAFGSLLETFGSFEAVRDAPVGAIEEAIRAGGLARVKAPRIKQVLERLQAERGELNLDFLRDLPLAEARAYLTGLGGVGPKTAACVLLFALERPAIPVDTHVHRVSRRLGLIGPSTSAERAHPALEAIVPPEQAYAFHMNLIRHGRQACPVAELCPRVGIAVGPSDGPTAEGERAKRSAQTGPAPG
jgi:endonuclease-3